MGRPMEYFDDTTVAVNTGAALTTLQARSERRAIIHAIIDNGGRMRLDELDEKFGYDIRAKVTHLIRLNWLEIVE